MRSSRDTGGALSGDRSRIAWTVTETLSALLVLPPLALMVRHHWAMPWSRGGSFPLVIAGMLLTMLSGALFNSVMSDRSGHVLWIAGQVLIGGLVVWLHLHVEQVTDSLDSVGDQVEAWGARRSGPVRVAVVALVIVLLAGTAIVVAL